jgi:hypothetical protein
MSRTVFTDCETTSLRPDRRAWEIAAIVREPGQPDAEHHWFIDADDLDLGNADLIALNIGRFFERHPQARLDREPEVTEYCDESDAMRELEAITRGAHLIGAVPNFDADVYAARMRAHGICPSWHYHLCDAENLIVGYLAGKGTVLLPPWKSDDLAAALGLKVSEDQRHTAMGDARFVRDIWDAIMGGPHAVAEALAATA